MTTIDIRAGAETVDVLRTTRNAKFGLVVAIATCLITQLILFLILRHQASAPSPVKPTDAKSEQSARESVEMMQYLIGCIDFAGMISSILLVMVIYLILQVQLSAGVLGVRRVTAGFVASLGLALVLFPWQAVLNNPSVNKNELANELGLKVPGVLYTWAEVSHPDLGAGFKVSADHWALNVMHWTRYIVFPTATLVLLGYVQWVTSRGIRQSVGGAATSPPF